MSTRRAFFFSFLDRYAALVLSVVSSMLISRLLTPSEIGIFSVTMIFMTFISSMRDLGAGQYLVQERELTPERISATWAVLLFTGVTMAVVILAAAYPMAHFYNEPRMFSIMLVISINFAINPFGSLTYAWLMREMRFDALAIIRFSGSATGAFTSAFFAWKGHGPISLAYGNLVSTLMTAAVSLRYRPANFNWLPRWGEVKRVLSFGGKISVTNLLWNCASGTPEMMLGKMQTLTSAGMYSRANGLAQMFQRILLDATQAVALPLFAQEQRTVGNIRQPLLLSISYVTALGWTFFIGLIVMCFPLTHLLYGSQWDESITITRLLSVGMMIWLPASMCPNALLAIGKPQTVLKITLIVVPIQIASVGIGASISLVDAAIGFAVAQALTLPVWLIATQREVLFDWRSFGLALVQSASLAMVTSISPLLCILAFGWEPTSSILPLACAAVMGILLLWGGAYWLRHPIQKEIGRLTARNLASLKNRFRRKS